MDSGDDRRLADAMAKGDEAAFNEFFNRYFDRLYRFALVRLDHDTHTAEDVVQQTLCRAMQKIKLYRGESALFTWLCSICRNTIADLFRAKGRQPSTVVAFEDSDEIRTALESLADLSAENPENSVLSQQIRRLVQSVLDFLPIRYADVLELKYIQGLTTREIANRMDTGTKATESLLGRARIAFREAFAKMVSSQAFDGLLGDHE